MSSQSSASSQIISLPKGGGALHGIGEKFSPDLHTGTGNFTVPIALPPGRNGFQPQLNLVYSTGNGNGPFGLGWSLSIPGVSRKTSKGVPQYDDSKDTFILSGSEDLVPVNGGPTETIRYRPRTEGLFARILHHRENGNDYWEVKSKDGLKSLYGTRAVAGNDPGAVADPANRSRVFAWKLTNTTDLFGNRIEYLYKRDAVQTDGPHKWDQLYLEQIRYVDYGEDPAKPQFLVNVNFIYEERPDPFSEYRARFEIRTIKRCTRIEVYTKADEERPVRTYNFTYLDQRKDANGVSMLSQVVVAGHDGDLPPEELPPLEFGYTRFEPNRRDFFPVKGRDLPATSLTNPDLELVDLFGNGLPDVLEMSGTVRYWRNLGNGSFDLPREMSTAPAGLRLSDSGVQLIDANGDGRTDLLVTTDGLAGYFPISFGGSWDRRSFQPYRMAPSFNLEDPEVRLVDLDGDGVTDAIRSGSRFEYFFNDPKVGWNRTRQAEQFFPNVDFSDPRVKWADMTGDGLQDIVLVYDGNVEYWPNLGRGKWGERISMRSSTQNSPRFPYGYDPKRILLGDVDGDGLADLVYVDDTKVTLWINQSGNKWSDPIEIQGTPPVTELDSVRLVDLLGTGVSGVLWSADAGGLSRDRMFFLDFTGGTKPYLLNQMNNHMGSLTRVGYSPSTRFYLEDQKRRATRWKTPLPFPVQVVARVEVIDEISRGKLTTEYSYHHGYWDGVEREFRGFGRVDHRDTELFAEYHAPGLHSEEQVFNPVAAKFFSPPTETRTWFHQGPIEGEVGEWEETDFNGEFWSEDPQLLTRPPPMIDFLKELPRRVKRDALRTLRGHILRTELYALDGTDKQDRPYTITEQLSGVREEEVPASSEDPRPRIFFPHLLSERTTQWERGNDPLTQFKFAGDYDDYGQPLSQISIAVPQGRDFRMTVAPGDPYLVTQTITAYAQRDDPDLYVVDRVARISSYEILKDGDIQNQPAPGIVNFLKAITTGSAKAKLIGQTLNFYDGPAFQGLPFGQIGEYGALVRTEALVLTDEIIGDAYLSSGTVTIPSEKPVYLIPGATTAWTPEYPLEFRNLLSALAGYDYQPGGANSEYAGGYYVVTERRSYDFHDNSTSKGRGLVRITRNPLGRDTTISYDDAALRSNNRDGSYDFLPVEVKDAAGLTTQAIYDYRVLQPREVVDANGNRSVFTFTPLGLLKSAAVMGKTTEQRGDTTNNPGTKLKYDFLAFDRRRDPVSVRTIKRVHHVDETDVPLPERDETIETVEYSDGFGRLLQTRTQAEDTIFGDPVFGGNTLPIDQTDPSGTGADVVGRMNADPLSPNVVVSGWQTYNNKGSVVEKYEPFFSAGWKYSLPTNDQRGQKATMYYDPRGHMIRTINPDGSEQRVIFGIPRILSQLDEFAPTPWESYTYDANDLAQLSQGPDGTSLADAAPATHYFTPTSTLLDALGRTVKAIERIGPGVADEYTTFSQYDIQGNLIEVIDALGRTAFKHVYDLAKHPLRTESIDAGIHCTVLDAAGQVIEQRDSKGALILHTYDLLNRPTRLWARDDSGSSITLRERLEYGDVGDPNQPTAERDANQAANRLGKLYKHFDEAGLLTFEAYDFKGNVLEKSRQVISDAAILNAFSGPPPNWQVPAFRVDWQSAAGTTLDATVFQTSLSYDALNRIKLMSYPRDVDGNRQQLRPRYNRAGALESVKLDNAEYVKRIAYNAKGQRTFIAYGNGVMPRHAYEPKTFRMARMRTEQFTSPEALTYRPAGEGLQDFGYSYDLVGNIRQLMDRTPGSGVLNNPDARSFQTIDPEMARLLVTGDALVRRFEYDALYRLLSAEGRECAAPAPPPWDDSPRCIDLTQTHGYREQYKYDRVGNMEKLQHTGDGNSFTREFAHAPDNNRLATMTIGTTVYDYTYDVNGNLIQETTSRHFEWDHRDRMRVYRTQTAGSEPSVHANYLYDASGQRVKKLVRKQGGEYEVTIYVDGTFEYHRLFKSGEPTRENNTLHVMDNQSRIAMVRVGNAFPDDGAPEMKVKQQLGDHLGSSNVVIGGATVAANTFINREEYTPYGETSFGSLARKRYRFTSKERDEESELYYHGARYYAPWLGRWVSCDPEKVSERGSRIHEPKNSLTNDQRSARFASEGAGSVYEYVRNNALKFIDGDGLAPTIFIGNLEGLFPETPTLTVEHSSRAPSVSVTIHVSDWRNLKGFNEAAKRAISAAVSEQTKEKIREISTAKIVKVGSQAQLEEGFRSAGSNRSLYFGHSDVSGLHAVGLAPAGVGGESLSAEKISRALDKKTPTPILETCMGGTLELQGDGRQRAIGPRNFIKIDDYQIELTEKGKSKARQGKPLTEHDINLKSFTISETPNPPGYLNQGSPLPNHIPAAPE